MSAIFKNRKTPRHLVIEQEMPLLRRKRRILPFVLFAFLVLLLLAAGFLQVR